MRTPVLRLAASYRELPKADCAVPERCQERHCADCGQSVHYDPAAAIPALGPERIVCETCMEAYL